MAALGEATGDDWEWVGASPTPEASAASIAKSKSARKNQNRQKKKKQQRQSQLQHHQQLQPAGAAIFDGVTYSVAEDPNPEDEDEDDCFPGLETALKLSAEAVEVHDRETLKSRIKHCRKLLRAIEDLTTRPKETLDKDQQAKVNRRPAILEELAALEVSPRTSVTIYRGGPVGRRGHWLSSRGHCIPLVSSASYPFLHGFRARSHPPSPHQPTLRLPLVLRPTEPGSSCVSL